MAKPKPASRPVAKRRGGRLPLVPIAPLIVAVIAITTAVAITAAAAKHLQQASDQASGLRSRALAATLAAHIRSAPAERRGNLLNRASRLATASFLLVNLREISPAGSTPGTIIGDHSAVSLSAAEITRLLNRAEGVTQLGGKRVRFSAAVVSPPLAHLSVMSFVEAPTPAVGTARMRNTIAVLTLLLTSVAMTVALLFTRTARDDVTYVRRRIAAMARAGSQRGLVGELVPLRSLDQVGLLTASLNNLIERFASAERCYREDLKAAARLDTERSQFLAGLSHELRTPLNAILGFTHLLESDDEGPLSGDAIEALMMIRRSGEHLKALIDDILDLSAMETGQVRLSRVVVDVYALADEVMRQARATLKHRPIKLVVAGDREVLAWADPRRLRQILTNLVSNALKATAEGEVRIIIARTSVATSKEKDMAIVKVHDSGRGIEPTVLDVIFEPYKQAGDVAARRGGVGLGLAITRRLIQLHGGTIEAKSELGGGSQFRFTLPDETHSTRVPRDSLMPFSETPVSTLPPKIVGAR